MGRVRFPLGDQTLGFGRTDRWRLSRRASAASSPSSHPSPPVPGELLLYNHIIIIDSLLQYCELASLGVAGGTVKGYGCPGLPITASGVAMAEMAWVDASCSTFILVHSSLAMVTIALCGSEAHKQKYLPSLVELTTVGCWGATTASEFSYNSIYPIFP